MKTRSDYAKEACNELAAKLTKKGYSVYLSDGSYTTYGFYTNGVRCVYFQYDLFEGFKYTTCMQPSRAGGTGWQLEENMDFEAMLYPLIPGWSNSNGIFLTESQNLAKSKHSNYKLFEAA